METIKMTILLINNAIIEVVINKESSDYYLDLLLKSKFVAIRENEIGYNLYDIDRNKMILNTDKIVNIIFEEV